jgi:pyruvate kinase
MILELVEIVFTVVQLNISHDEHASHKDILDLVQEINVQAATNVIVVMFDAKLCFVVVM